MVFENKMKEICGMGMVFDGVVHFKELDRNTTETKTHSSVGLYGNRNRFRYINGKVEWTDTPEKEATIKVEDYLHKREYPFIKHSHYFSSAEINVNDLSENIQKIVKPSVPESKEGRFWWLSPDGKFYPVMFQYHEEWAKRYLINDVGMSEEQFTDSPYKILRGMGWMRVGIMWNDYAEDSVMEFDYDQTKSSIPNYKLVKIINDFAIEKGIKYIKDSHKRPTEVFENTKISKSKFKKLIKEIVSVILESRLNGEWWFENGTATFADGDVGDMNHEAVVITRLKSEILDSLGIDTMRCGDYLPNISELKDEIFKNIGDEFDKEEKLLWSDEAYSEAVVSYLKRKGESDIEEKMKYAEGYGDAREYALKRWGWQRVKQNNIQTQTLTTKDLSNIVRGLDEAYGEELNDTDEDNISDDNPTGEQTFNIEVMSTRSWYTGIPLSILEKKNPVALNPYRSRY